MNDRYLFRAKRVDNGEWVIGHYQRRFDLLGNEEHYIFSAKSHNVWEYAEIEPSTICQCSGLKDKNGKLIWENDVLIGYLDDNYPDDETYACVIWNNNGFYLKENGCIDISLIDETDEEFFEVCGNIFDNPELCWRWKND